MNIFLFKITFKLFLKQYQKTQLDTLLRFDSIFFLISDITSTIKDNKIAIANISIGNGFNLNRIFMPSTYNTIICSKIPITNETFRNLLRNTLNVKTLLSELQLYE